MSSKRTVGLLGSKATFLWCVVVQSYLLQVVTGRQLAFGTSHTPIATSSPTSSPTLSPTSSPTLSPTSSPTSSPTAAGYFATRYEVTCDDILYDAPSWSGSSEQCESLQNGNWGPDLDRVFIRQVEKSGVINPYGGIISSDVLPYGCLTKDMDTTNVGLGKQLVFNDNTESNVDCTPGGVENLHRCWCQNPFT